MTRAKANNGSEGRTLKTVSIGGATFDLFVACPHSIIDERGGKSVFALPLGEKIPVDRIIGACGGGASNTSVGLSRLGCTAGFIGVVGDDQWGQALLKNLKDEGVSTDGVTIVENETSSFSIIFNAENGERVIVYDAGTNEHLHDVTFPRHVLEAADWVYLNHLHERSCAIQDDLVALLTAATAPQLTWNPGGCQISMGMHHPLNRKMLAQSAVLLVNKEEAFAFTGATTIPEALRAFMDTGVRRACITDGKRGATATDGKSMVACPNAPASAVDTTGAGDGFGTALTWAIATGLDLPTALRAASINAASVVSAIGAQPGLLTDTDIRRKLDTVELGVQTSAF